MENYEQAFELILEDLSKIHSIGSNLPGVKARLKTTLEYNVPYFNEFRGFLVPKMFCGASKEPHSNDVQTANLVGWCLQIHQSFLLMSEDMNSDSETRFGKKCWHRQPDNKSAAINDVVLLELLALQLLNFYLKDTPEKLSLIEALVQNATFDFLCGQSENALMSWKENHLKFTFDAYIQTNKFKAGICQFSLPFHVGMTLAGLTQETSPQLWEAVEEIGLEMGLLKQVQEDYLHNKEGCDGDDIRNGRCTWIFLKAQELCDEKERKQLDGLYGNPDKDSVDSVLGLYKTLNLREEFIKFEDETVKKIQGKIDELPVDCGEIKDVLEDTLNVVLRRAKDNRS